MTLRPMSDAELDDWFARSQRGYADDLVRAHDRAEADARTRVEAMSARLLPDGRLSR